MFRKIQIPKFLQELHGEEASVFSIVLVYLTGIIFGIFCFSVCQDLQNNLYRWLLSVIALDIGGGVVANMSQGTTDYYAKRPKVRWVFIFIHIIHPFLLWIVFPNMIGILIVGATTLIFTAIVNGIPGVSNQRIVSATLFIFNLMLLIIFKVDILPLMLLSVFSLKMIVSFGVRWNEITQANRYKVRLPLHSAKTV
jgi:hypothetical protein